MLIGQVIPLAVKFLESEPTASFLSRFDHILVDEYQDLNAAEQRLCELLATNASSTVVGDADQSIYAFKCAEAQGLLEYGSRPDVENDILGECRRCPPDVVGLANATVARNTVRSSQPMTAVSTRPGCIFYRRYADLLSEATGVAKFIADAVNIAKVDVGRTLVLSTSRELGQMIKEELMNSHRIEAMSYFYEKALEEKSAQRAFSLLKLVVNRYDRVSLRFLLGYNRNAPENSGWRVGEYAVLRRYCEQHDLEPWEALSSTADGLTEIPDISALLSEFRQIRHEVSALDGKNAQEILDSLFPKAQSWAADARMAAGENVAEGTTIEQLYDLMLSEITQPTMPSEVAHVRIMSLHRSKGLTAAVVAICGCVNGLIPRQYDAKKTVLDADGHLEEQRRLFYVGLTRTTDYLLLSSAASIPRDKAHKMGLGGLLRRRGALVTTASTFLTDLQPQLPPVERSTDFF